MAQRVRDTVNTNIVLWSSAIKHLDQMANRSYRQAAKAPTEFERGRFSGRGEMCEELRNLPETLAVLSEEDTREKERAADVKGEAGPSGQ